MDNMNPDDTTERMIVNSKLRSPNQVGDTNTMSSFQDGGQQTMNTEQSEFSQAVDMSHMNLEMNSYPSSSSDQAMGSDTYGRMNENVHPGQVQAYSSFNRGNFIGDPTQHGGLAMAGSGEFANQTNPFHGQYSQSNYRPSFSGGPKPGMSPIRPGMGIMHTGYLPSQRFMSAQNISQQGSTPTLNQLLQTPNSSSRYQQNSYNDYGALSPKGAGEIPSGNPAYTAQQSWNTNQRTMNTYPSQSAVPSSPFRNQQGGTMNDHRRVPNPSYSHPSGQYVSQQMSPNSQRYGMMAQNRHMGVGSQVYGQQLSSQYGQQGQIGFPQTAVPSSQSHLYTSSQQPPQQQAPPSGQPPGASPTPQSQTSQPSSQQSSPQSATSQSQQQQQQQQQQPSPVPHSPQHTPTSQSGSRQLSPSPQAVATTWSSKKTEENDRVMESGTPDDLNSENSQGSRGTPTPAGLHHSSSIPTHRPIPSPVGSTGSRSNTPASGSGNQAGSPMPPRPPAQQQLDGQNPHMSQSPMATQGYNQMMPPPMGSQMGYAPGSGKMGGAVGTPAMGHYQHYNSQFPQSGNYGRQHGVPSMPNTGMQGYPQQSMYNGPNQMGHMPGTQMYNNMPMGRGTSNSNYMYGPGGPSGQGGTMGIPGQYGSYNNFGSSSGPSQGQSIGVSNQNMAMGGPNQSVPGSGSGSTSVTPPSGVNSPNLPGQAVSPSSSSAKGAQAAAQAAMMAAANSAAIRPPNVRAPLSNPPRMLGPASVSEMNQTEQINHMGFNSDLTNLENSVNRIPSSSSPVPPPSMIGHVPNSGIPDSSNVTNCTSSVPAEMPLSAQSGIPPSSDRSTLSPVQGTTEELQPDTIATTTDKSEDTSVDKTSMSSTSALTATPVSLTNSIQEHHSPSPSSTPSMQDIDSKSNTVPLSSVPESISNMNSNACNDVSVTEPGVLSASNVPITSVTNMPNVCSPSSASCSSIVSSATDIAMSESQQPSVGPVPASESNNECLVKQPVDGTDQLDVPSRAMEIENQQPCNNLSSANEETYPITTTANCTVVSSTVVTQSITSPVASISEAGNNSNDSQMENIPVPSSNCNPMVPVPTGPMIEEPAVKKNKMSKEGISYPLTPASAVTPSPGGTSISSLHEDLDNISSPTPSWTGVTKTTAGDFSRMYEMGMEPDRRAFLDQLVMFLDDRGAPITAMPAISKQPLDLYKLYFSVREKGGMVEVTKAKKWKEICGIVNIGCSASAAFTLKKNYIKYLFAFECHFDRGGIDPKPILAQMEAQLAQKREMKRGRAPSPGSQGSQEAFRPPSTPSNTNPGMESCPPSMNPNYMSNAEQAMGPMHGMMHPNAMMNNMGGPNSMMPPNSMSMAPGMPHHMHPGHGNMHGNMMVGSGGSMPSGGNPNIQYMMPSGPGSMMPNAMPQSGGMMPNVVGVPSNSGGMMGSGSMSSGSTLPPSVRMPSGGSMPPASMQSNSNSVSCQDPFADEPSSANYPRASGNSQMPPFSGVHQPPTSMPNNMSYSNQQNMPQNMPNYSGMTQSLNQSNSMNENSSRMNSQGEKFNEPYRRPAPGPNVGPGAGATQVENAPNNSRPLDPFNATQFTSNSSGGATSGPGRQFPFGDHQFNRPDRFEQQQQQQQTSTPPQTASQQFRPPSQPGMVNQPYPVSQDQSAMFPGRSQQQSGMTPTAPEKYSSQNYANQSFPKPGSGVNPEQYSNYPPQGPNPNSNQPSAGYPNQRVPASRDMPTGGHYGTPSKRYPDMERKDGYITPAYSPQPYSDSRPGQSPGQNAGSMHYSRDGIIPQQDGSLPAYNHQPYGDSRPGHMSVQSSGPLHYAPQSREGMMPQEGAMLVHPGLHPPTCSDRARSGPTLPYPQQYPKDGFRSPPETGCLPGGYKYMPTGNQPHSYMSHPPDDFTDSRRDASQWSPIQQRHPQGPMGPQAGPGMIPMYNNRSMGPRMSPHKDKAFFSPPKKASCIIPNAHLPQKKEIAFPPDSVEAAEPLLVKRRRLNKSDVDPVDPWRLMMSLKSGLLAESTWALDTLNILLYDDVTVMYFGLSHLPGLLEVLLEHFRRCLIEMFGEFEDVEIIKDTNQSFNESDDSMLSEKSLSMNEKVNENDEKIDEPVKEEISARGEEKKGESENSDSKSDISVEPDGAKSSGIHANYTYVTRRGVSVKLVDDEVGASMLQSKVWDIYSGFCTKPNHFHLGGGDTSRHILTYFESLDEYNIGRKLFYSARKMTYKDEDESSVGNHCESETDQNNLVIDDGVDKETDEFEKISEAVTEKSKENSFSLNMKGHTCNNYINKIHIKKECNIETEQKSIESSSDMKIDVKKEPVDISDNVSMKLDKDLMSSDVKPDATLFQNDNLDKEEKMDVKVKEQFDKEAQLEIPDKISEKTLQLITSKSDQEDEAYQKDQYPLNLISTAQDELGRRCICISNIFRSLSCVPGNDGEMSKHPGLVYILGKLLLLHHTHLPRSKVCRKLEHDDELEEPVEMDQSVDEWWWDYLNALRENTLVIFANICGKLDLSKFPQEVCLPVLDGLLHWAVCPSACATDPLPTVSPNSVLSPQRLVLEALCKLCIHESNVDLLLAAPPFQRIVQLFGILGKLLSNKSEPVTQEFAIVLLSELVEGDSSAARAVALQHPCISLLIDFLEAAEQKAVQVAHLHGINTLRDNPEIMGTSLDMLRRAANILLHLSQVPQNRTLFVHHQSRLLSLVMSQILDQLVAQIVSDVLFHCSDDLL